MQHKPTWKEFWEARGAPDVSDFDFDRGATPRDAEIDRLASEELLEFIDPKTSDVVFDAGCGSGANIKLLHSRVHRITAVDYAESAVARCRKRVETDAIANVEMSQGDICASTLPDSSVDVILCMSVLQYLDQEKVRAAFANFARILKGNGTLVLHVKNLASLYLSTLYIAKRLASVVRKGKSIEYFRTFDWYIRELHLAGFQVVAYNSFNFFMIEKMPPQLLARLQELEIRRRAQFPFNTDFMRKHGSDLKIKARLVGS